MNELRETLANVKRKIARYGSKDINEQNTKATLIQPVLRALGWDVEELDDVQLEYKRRKSDKPVDYALMLIRQPRFFVEAKALGHSLDDRKWASQIMGYATVAGVEWVVLTNGDEYRVYNSHAPVPVEEKLFRQVQISDDETNAGETLALLSKDHIRENEIDALWNAHFVDRQVRAAVEELFATDPDPDASLVRLVAKRVHNLTARDIKDSLRRAQIRFDFPVDPTTARPVSASRSVARPTKKPAKSKKKAKKTKQYVGVSLADVIGAGLLKPPLKLVKHYKGHDLEAQLLPNGSVIFDGTTYTSCSSAAEHARGSITGRVMNTNGWTFWKHAGEDGKLVELDEARQKYIKANA